MSNSESDALLLRLLRAYRASRTEQAVVSITDAQQALRVELYRLVTRVAGAQATRSADGSPTGERVGFVALRYGLSNRAEELAWRVWEKIERDAEQSELGYLSEWREDGGASIATWVTRLASNVASTMLDEQFEDAIRARRPAARSHNDDESLREQARRLRREAAGSHDRWEPIFTPFDAALEAQLPAVDETPLQQKLTESGIRVLGGLLPLLQRIASQMPGEVVSVRERQIELTPHHTLVLRAYLALDPSDREHLYESVEALAKRKNFGLKGLKADIAAGFAWLISHPDFPAVCEALVPARLRRSLSDTKLRTGTSQLQQLLASPEASNQKFRAGFRALVHSWIEDYGFAQDS